MTGDHHDAIIIGGGISGTATAYELAKQGVSTLLLERGDLASMASGWTLAGVRQSGRHPAELPLAKAAVRRWETLAEELGEDVEYRQNGNLRLALTPDEVPNIRQVASDANGAGIPTEVIEDPDTIQEIAPPVIRDIAGASFCPTDGHANNHLVVRAYASAAQRHGAEIRTGTEARRLLVDGDRVTGVETADGRAYADTVIVAAGIYAPPLLAPLGLDLPLEVVLTPVVQTEIAEPALGPVLGVAEGTFAGRQEASGRYRLIGASTGWDESQHTDRNTMPSLRDAMAMLQGIDRVLPGISALRVHRIWGGLIDRTPDALPVIEANPDYRGLVIGAGFSGHGFGIGPATGEILAALATSGTSPLPIEAFTLARLKHGVKRQDLAMHG